MDDYTLMMVKMRGEELMREARQGRRAAGARRAARTRPTVPTAARGLVIRSAQWLAMAAARMRPTTTASTAASTAVIAAERVAVAGEAIRRLPESQRITLTMAAAGGMTSAELAATLGVPAGTVRYRLSLARRAVAEALDRYDDPTEK
jgi:RNA polymerase sigma-70 factor (ECF subfamily)